MSVFTDFLEEEIILLVSMPYRTGLWMSHQDDDESTERDDQKEMIAMEAVLKKIAGQKKQTPFLSAVVAETLAYQNLWPQWAQGEESFLSDAKKVAQLVEGRMAVDNALNYRNGLVQVANAVALAYGEFGAEDEAASKPSFLGNIVNKLSDKMTALSGDADNMSLEEQEALKRLKSALAL